MMSMEPTDIQKLSAAAIPDSAKRRQIMEGARAVFLEQGFDASSMGEIARRAGVSKGTLYVYFESKEELFHAIFEEECRSQAEQVFSLDPNDHNVEAVLLRLGVGYVHFLCQPSRLSAMRTVISIAERMPQMGRKFYETGPGFGIGRLSRYFKDQVAAGVLEIEDCEVAAAQFLDSCQSMLFKPMMFNIAGPPSEERIQHVIGIAVRTFLAAYHKRA